MKHDELVERGVKWLRRANSGRGMIYRGACGVVVPELNAFAVERPDVIGWANGGASCMLECKASRQDFLADQRKGHRATGTVGARRWYLCPTGMIEAEEVPEGWGLLHCGRRQIRTVLDAPANPERNIQAELEMMYSLLRRVEVRGMLTRCLSPKWGGDRQIGGNEAQATTG